MNCAPDAASKRSGRLLAKEKNKARKRQNAMSVSNAKSDHVRRSARERRPARKYLSEIDTDSETSAETPETAAETSETSETSACSTSSTASDNSDNAINAINNGGCHGDVAQYAALVAFDADRVRQLCARGGSQCSLRWARRVAFSHCSEEYDTHTRQFFLSFVLTRSFFFFFLFFYFFFFKN
jgi:hypothetical protein